MPWQYFYSEFGVVLHYLSLAGMMQAIHPGWVSGDPNSYCNACFTGDYPLPVDMEQAKTGFERAMAGNL